MRTIIQHIGPLYGELNTGSVFGQPNGSIAISQNLVPTPTPSEPTKEEIEIWDLSYYKTRVYGSEVTYNLFNTTITDDTLTFTSARRNASGTLVAGEVFCLLSVLSPITETNTTAKFEVATDESFSSIIFSEIISTPYGSVESQSFSGVEKPNFSTGTTYYFRIRLYSSSGTYLYKKSDVLSMKYYSG